MICPVCQTQNVDTRVEHCAQCGTDLQVHRLLQTLQEKNTMQTPPKSVSFFQLFVLSVLLIGSLLAIALSAYVFIQLHHTTKDQIATQDKWSTINMEQLQKMNTMIQQELNFIIEQHQENRLLQEKIETLTTGKSQSTSHAQDQ